MPEERLMQADHFRSAGSARSASRPLSGICRPLRGICRQPRRKGTLASTLPAVTGNHVPRSCHDVRVEHLWPPSREES